MVTDPSSSSTSAHPSDELVPVSAVSWALSRIGGTLELVDGELVIRVRPNQGPQHATARRIPREQPTTLVGLPYMRYAGPLTGVARGDHYAILACWERRSQRRWWWSW